MLKIFSYRKSCTKNNVLVNGACCSFFNSFKYCSMRYLLLVISFFILNQVFSQCISGNCINGTGTFIFPSGGKYSGHFVNSKLAGQGTFYYTNGNIYTGDWRNNIREGVGQLVMPTGDEYTGDFKANKFWGKGTYKFQSGEYYIGDWYNDKAKGKGKYIFPTGEEYSGEFENGKFHGYGLYRYANKESYEGYWIDNKRHGEGKLIDSFGSSQYGIWVDDNLVSPLEKSKSNLSVQKSHEGDINRDCQKIECKSGLGYYIYKDGSKWEGEFANGKPGGSGTCYYANGNRYEGSWAKNVPEGTGMMFLKNGEIYGGTWEKGVLIRKDKITVEADYESDEIENRPETDIKINIWAMIIGIGSYDHMPVLKYTDDDAYQIYAFLRSPEGGLLQKEQIRLLIDENATQKGIRNGLDFLVSNADENDVILIYFAGHGLKGAFVPYDYDGYNNLVSHEEILTALSKSSAKHKVLIADACHSGSLIAQRSPFSSNLKEYYSDFENLHGGTALIMSSKENENSLEFSGMRQGVFSYFMLEGLNGKADFDNNGIVDITELFEYININVRKYTNNNQNPLISGDFDPKMPLGVVREKY